MCPHTRPCALPFNGLATRLRIVLTSKSLGLTPLNNSSGGKERLGHISKMGDQYLRRLLVTGMTSLVRRNKHHLNTADPRINALLARKPVRLVTVAMGEPSGASDLGHHGARRGLPEASSPHGALTTSLAISAVPREGGCKDPVK